jgi:hypothetical protein
MQTQIISKLNEFLKNEIKSEADVVYILSRIRKLWESLGKPDKYTKLIFYCDWALHTNIKNTDRVEYELKQFINDTFSNEIIDFTLFKKEFQIFLKDFELPYFTIDNENKFNNLREILIQIYSDTPLYIKGGINKKITFTESRHSLENQHFSIGYKIEEI